MSGFENSKRLIVYFKHYRAKTAVAEKHPLAKRITCRMKIYKVFANVWYFPLKFYTRRQ
jgi:hypothetical protein